MPDELVDVVDDDDVVVATVPRAVMRRERLRHRVSFVVIRATDGRILVHRRSDDKDVWPGRWDLAVGGVVTAGEPYDAAAERELAEEVGVTGVPLVSIGTGRYEDDDVRILARLYEAAWDGPFTFADGEVVEARFVTLPELHRRLAADSFVPDSVALLLPLLSDPA
jgi:8-oxo-dGTP pyrophosphatase MutT (NUDIX family)